MSFDLTPRQRDIQARSRRLAAGLVAANAAEIDRSERWPLDNVKALTRAGFMGMTIPRAYGGPGHSFLDAILVVEEMAAECGSTGRIVVEGNMGAISAIMRYGDEAQRQRAAELVLGGDKPAICITEPEAGSAAMAMTTRADKRGDVYILNGKKHWITGGGVSRLHLIFAQVYDEAGAHLGIGGFLAVRGETRGEEHGEARGETRGLEIGAREPTMGLRGMPETEIILNNLEVSEAMVLTPPSGFRQGFADLMNAYNAQRVGAGTVALGLAVGACRRALAFAREREQFGRPIAEFQGLQWMLADMSVQIEAARALLYRAARNVDDDNPFPDPTLAAQAKIFSSEMAIRVTNDALQIFGARGYSRNFPMERIARDARMFTIGGGTAQILRTFVAGRILDRKLPQTRDGYNALAPATRRRQAAE